MVKDKDLSHFTPGLDRKKRISTERKQVLLGMDKEARALAATKQAKLEAQLAKKSKAYAEWLQKGVQKKLGD